MDKYFNSSRECSDDLCKETGKLNHLEKGESSEELIASAIAEGIWALENYK